MRVLRQMTRTTSVFWHQGSVGKAVLLLKGGVEGEGKGR